MLFNDSFCRSVQYDISCRFEAGPTRGGVTLWMVVAAISLVVLAAGGLATIYYYKSRGRESAVEPRHACGIQLTTEM